MEARHESTAGTEISVHLAEHFTPLEARVLHDVASRIAPGALIDLDFRAVRVCHDVALLLLAQDIQAGLAQYTLRGLSSHHLRVLGYLGARETGQGPEPVDPSLD
jgi:hypothetical protein